MVRQDSAVAAAGQQQGEAGLQVGQGGEVAGSACLACSEADAEELGSMSVLEAIARAAIESVRSFQVRLRRSPPRCYVFAAPGLGLGLG